MRKLITTFCVTVGLALSTIAGAANVAPLGLEVGVATMEQVKARIGAQTRLTHRGINAYSDGTMLGSDGQGLDIEGLEDVLFIFDKSDRLEGVVMTISKHRFQEVYQFMGGKYTLRKKVIPFVGDNYARFTHGSSFAEITAPHMSFSMEVRYLTNALEQSFKKRRAANEAQRKQEQGAKF